MFNDDYWFSLKNLGVYSHKYHGRRSVGLRRNSRKISSGLKWAGRGLGAYNAYTTYLEYSANNITDFQFAIEQSSNAFSTLGGIYSVGWEIGRGITHIPAYQNWKHDTWLPWRSENLGY